MSENIRIQNKEQIQNVKLLESEKAVKRDRDLAYLLELDSRSLLFSFYTEAGIAGPLNLRLSELNIHDGWDNPVSQIRGHFTGHWLSAAARIFQETGNQELKAKADFIVAEIRRCQVINGNGWAFSIPEKYLYGIRKGQHFWAPQYVCHKTMMGLLDMYQFAGNKTALEIVKECAQWFITFTKNISQETMNMMMDLEETGGMMELWGDLYEITGMEEHRQLMCKYERTRLTEQLLAGKDVLTNMHANFTIPEIHGCAKAYEITGEKRYRNIVESYWDLAVRKRGTFATGGQTDGEVWTGIQRQAARLSSLNQEHCTVYNMIRLANYLYRWTEEAEYLDYIEKNIENGLMAQGFWKAEQQNTAERGLQPSEGLVAYFLPLTAGSRKHWGSKDKDFWCCHGTLVQANARYREFIFYQSEKYLTIAQFIPAVLKTQIMGAEVKIMQEEADQSGSHTAINDIAPKIVERPMCRQMIYRIDTEKPVYFQIRIRRPWWLKGQMKIFVNGKETKYLAENEYVVLEKEWHHDVIKISLPFGLSCWPLPDEENTVAFMEGPVVLAGLVGEERILTGDIDHPETMIKCCHERQWSQWISMYRTINQPRGFYLKPLKDIGNQEYTVYFPVNMSKK